jgi:hypothetical protein
MSVEMFLLIEENSATPPDLQNNLAIADECGTSSNKIIISQFKKHIKLCK